MALFLLLRPPLILVGGTTGSPNISLNSDGSAAYVGKITSDSTVALDGGTTLTTKDYVDDLVGGEADWTSTGNSLYPTDPLDNVLIGGTLPGTPNISLNADGSAVFAGAITLDGVLASGGTGGNGGLSARQDTATTSAISVVQTSNENASFTVQGDGTTKLGGSQPTSPNIQLSADGSAVFTDEVTAPRFTGRVNASVVGPTPPLNPVEGDLWWNDVNGNMFVYYVDANSSQWVSTISEGNFATYVTTDTNQSISGTKRFTQPTIFDDAVSFGGVISAPNIAALSNQVTSLETNVATTSTTTTFTTEALFSQGIGSNLEPNVAGRNLGSSSVSWSTLFVDSIDGDVTVGGTISATTGSFNKSSGRAVEIYSGSTLKGYWTGSGEVHATKFVQSGGSGSNTFTGSISTSSSLTVGTTTQHNGTVTVGSNAVRMTTSGTITATSISVTTLLGNHLNLTNLTGLSQLVSII